MVDFFSSILGRGRAAPTAPVIHNNPTAHTPGAPSNPNDRVQQVNPNADPTKGIPGDGQSQPTNQQEPISPLDQFKDVWQPVKDAKGNPVVNTDPRAQPIITSDPAKFAEQARKMDFTSGIDPTVAKKALEGDTASLMQLINESSQNAFMAASQLSTTITESATRTNNSRTDSVMQEKFKEFLLNQERTENPILSHPAVSPMLDLAKQQLMRKHPDKSAGEIQKMAETMMGNFADALHGDKTQKADQVNKGNVDPTDFSTW